MVSCIWGWGAATRQTRFYFSASELQRSIWAGTHLVFAEIGKCSSLRCFRCAQDAAYLCICKFVYLCIYVFVYLCICVLVYLCICVFVYLCICVLVYLAPAPPAAVTLPNPIFGHNIPPYRYPLLQPQYECKTEQKHIRSDLTLSIMNLSVTLHPFWPPLPLGCGFIWIIQGN